MLPTPAIRPCYSWQSPRTLQMTSARVSIHDNLGNATSCRVLINACHIPALWSRRGVIPVNIEWLLSSLGNFQLLPLSRWLLRPRSTINVEEERIKRLLDAS